MKKLTCIGSRGSPGTPRGEGSLNFGVVAWTAVGAATVDAAAVGAAAEEEEADPEALGGGDTP